MAGSGSGELFDDIRRKGLCRLVIL